MKSTDGDFTMLNCHWLCVMSCCCIINCGTLVVFRHASFRECLLLPFKSWNTIMTLFNHRIITKYEFQSQPQKKHSWTPSTKMLFQRRNKLNKKIKQILTNFCRHFKVSILININTAYAFGMTKYRNSFTHWLYALNHFTWSTRDYQIYVIIEVKKVIYIFSCANL